MDRRLIGTWRSDKRRTTTELQPWLQGSVRRAELFATILGKLTLRYTRSHVHASGIGEPESRPYRIIARDEDSVVIEVPDHVTARPSLTHIHFEDGGFWVSMGAHREWFKRIQESKRTSRRAG